MKRVICFFFILFTSCTILKEINTEKMEQDPSKSISLELIVHDSHSGIEFQEFRVIEDLGALKKLFLQINKTRKPGFPIPEIDFDKDIVVAYFSGLGSDTRPPELFFISENDSLIKLGIKEKIVPELVDTNAISTSAFCIYKMKNSGKIISVEGL
ncbi:hypothetical protein HCG49_10985 [Arenibacter sp. 6A1]|uniref:hypothetical protein n=1 Tax=Arenibacter sp. 6A1 TaxID=2720391 RepID=UPI001445E4F5|nr:hypothetical protein [Arenibacter sp. 6A1]NKI27088.1 hypothetical protein [Arenibacter sp. 6A1]